MKKIPQNPEPTFELFILWLELLVVLEGPVPLVGQVVDAHPQGGDRRLLVPAGLLQPANLSFLSTYKNDWSLIGTQNEKGVTDTRSTSTVINP